MARCLRFYCITSDGRCMTKILLAEDDKNLSRSIDILLTLDGHQVISVYNGEEALHKLLLQRYDLLITDIVMPNTDGIELINKIRLINSDLPIMVVSGKLNSQLIKLLETMEIKHILPKPINPTRFRKMVQKILGKNGNS
jgi:DNA-binding response OmpR family regulator